MTITFIEPHETYTLRHRILRPNQSLEDCKYPADFEPDTFHLGAFLKGSLVSVASFYQEKHPDLPGSLHYRLRGMATITTHRKQKAGSSLIGFAEDFLRQRQASHWWCNARTTVFEYYERFGMTRLGEPFDIPPIGMHVLMVKPLALTS